MEGEEEGDQASTGTLGHPPAPASTHPKHAAMLERLSNRHHHSLSRKTDPTNHSFLSLFSQSKLSIDSQISLLRRQSTQNQPNPDDTLKSDLETISTSISHLEKLVAENSYSLPSFEVRTCLESVSTLKQTLDALASDIVPKKRFSFKSKKDPSTVESPITECHGSREPSCTDGEKKALSSVLNGIESESREGKLEGEARFRVWDSPGLKDRENEVLVRDFKGLEMGEFSLTGLTSCEVRFTGCLRALFVHKLRDCKVYVGPVFGSVLIEEVEGCVFVLASHQIRIHRARGSDFYLRVRSRPIIEDCSGVRFAPYCLGYDGIERDLKESNLDEETGNWANVDDFRWLKAMQSPNWSILPESEQIGRVTIMNSDKFVKSLYTTDGRTIILLPPRRNISGSSAISASELRDGIIQTVGKQINSSISHIVRDANQCADYLAHLGAEQGQDLITMDNLPLSIKEFMIRDNLGLRDILD